MTTLEKIRAEIDSYCSDNRDRNDGLYIAMKIIDKYAEQEPSDDVVSRQAVLDCATLITSIPTEDWDIGDWVCLFRDRVSQLPSVRPQEQTGHWIMNRQLERRTCDNCHAEYRWSFYPHNYCPNCGARMVESQESEDKE